MPSRLRYRGVDPQHLWREPMPNPYLDKAEFKKLTKTGSSPGTVTGSQFGARDQVFITTRDGKKKWKGPVGTQIPGTSTWNASVDNIQWNQDDKLVPETVTVTVSNTSGPSNPVDTMSDVS
jgi:hypothetical protein